MQVKQAVVRRGKAAKQQVRDVVQRLLLSPEPHHQADTADARSLRTIITPTMPAMRPATGGNTSRSNMDSWIPNSAPREPSPGAVAIRSNAICWRRPAFLSVTLIGCLLVWPAATSSASQHSGAEELALLARRHQWHLQRCYDALNGTDAANTGRLFRSPAVAVSSEQRADTRSKLLHWALCFVSAGDCGGSGYCRNPAAGCCGSGLAGLGVGWAYSGATARAQQPPAAGLT